MTSPIQSAKARHGLAEVARRTGIAIPDSQTGPLTVRCPMPAHGHPDRTPSLRLHLADGVWFCFGCSPRKPDGNPGRADVIEWVCQSEGIRDWREAIRVLDAGGPLTNSWATPTSVAPHMHIASGGSSHPGESISQAELPNLDRTPPQRVGEAVDAAWRYYTFGPLHLRGVLYLAHRCIDVTVLEDYNRRPEVGHTPGRATGLVDRLRASGFNDDELVDAGLAHRRLGGGPVSDFYRHRVLIPIRDAAGHIDGLIGRNVGDERWPKYKNPPRTHRYNKAINLYQPLPAPIYPDGQVVVVEGTLDAMAIAVAAIKTELLPKFCPVTQSGRELSDQQLDRVLGLHPSPPVIAFDGDAAGRDSNARLAVAVAQKGRETVITTLPDGADPTSWLAEHGPAELAAWTRKGSLETSLGWVHPMHVGHFLATVNLQHLAGQACDWKETFAALRKALAHTGVRLSSSRARNRFAEQSARALAEAGLGPDGWLARTLARDFEQARAFAGSEQPVVEAAIAPMRV